MWSVLAHCRFLFVPGFAHCYAQAVSMQFKASAAYRTQRQKGSFVCITAACTVFSKSNSKLSGQLSKLGIVHTHMPITNVLLSRRSWMKGYFFTRVDVSTDGG